MLRLERVLAAAGLATDRAPEIIDHGRSGDLVARRGDASLPNFISDGGADVTLIDLGRFGIADRYQDLALFLRSARRNHPRVDAVHLLRTHDPLADFDEARLDFYRFLDEFF